MSIINFTIPQTLEDRVTAIMKIKGFSSKAEFFRFAAIYFMDVVNKPTVSEDDQFEFLTESLRAQLQKQYKGKKLPSVSDQLNDL